MADQSIQWDTAEAKPLDYQPVKFRLEVQLEGTPNEAWIKTFEWARRSLAHETRAGGWGTVSLTGKMIEVQGVDSDSAEALMGFLDTIVRQTNAQASSDAKAAERAK